MAVASSLPSVVNATPYIDCVWLDIYYYSPTAKFQREFVPTITAVRSFTYDSILPKMPYPTRDARCTKIADLFAGARASNLLGFIWYNQTAVTHSSSTKAGALPSPHSTELPPPSHPHPLAEHVPGVSHRLVRQ